jgi:predicted RNA binding protein YcfA (HicA-like mRNA interferase family)
MLKLKALLEVTEAQLSELGPMKRRDIIDYLKDKGFTGPFSGAKHAFMSWKNGKKIVVPNPHGGEEYSRGLVNQIFKQADFAMAGV